MPEAKPKRGKAAKTDAAPAGFTAHTTPLPKDSAAGKSPPTPSPAQRASKMPKLSGMGAQIQKDLQEEAAAKERESPDVTECGTTFEPDYATADIPAKNGVGLFKAKGDFIAQRIMVKSPRGDDVRKIYYQLRKMQGLQDKSKNKIMAALRGT